MRVYRFLRAPDIGEEDRDPECRPSCPLNAAVGVPLYSMEMEESYIDSYVSQALEEETQSAAVRRVHQTLLQVCHYILHWKGMRI